jgi:hypothetical protein
MRAAAKCFLDLFKSLIVATLVCALVPVSGLQAQSTAQPDLHREIAAVTPGSAPYVEPSAGGVRGIALNGSEPVPGVQVIVHSVDAGTDRSVVSGRDGYFSVRNLKPGTYRLTAAGEGFVATPITVQVAAGQYMKIDLALGPNAAAPDPGTPQPAPDVPAPSASASASGSSAATTASSGDVPPAVEKKLEEMEARIAELETELKDKSPSTQSAAAIAPAAMAAPASASAPAIGPAPAAVADSAEAAPSSASSSAAAPADATLSSSQGAATPATPAKAPPIAPFSQWDYTWMNGNSRNKDTPLAMKYFTPEIRVDSNYTEDYNQPVDHSLGGSTETFRSGEVQVEQMSFGGDLDVGNARFRVLTMNGLFATTTPRNDGSTVVGQWDLRDAYRYVSEAWGGYHFNVNHGLNIDAGIFVSYIGLFSYYNFDNWTYQPSYVSSNTPWFFNGIRIQWFPTAKLKIEPWIINGWQSYAKSNGHMGLGGQILWRPNGWFSAVFNNYGMGEDTPFNPARSRIHTDDSIEIKYYDHPDNMGLDKVAMSFTGDLGCEYGKNSGVSCWGNKGGQPSQFFAGWMAYNRFWFHKDLFGLTLGGGQLNNPGRYLTLLPPINGADAISGSPYFPVYPGSQYKAFDGTITFDWMPSEFVTFRFENGYRQTNVPYWTGRHGITPPGGNTGTPGSYICTNGTTSAASDFTPSGLGFTADNVGNAVANSCSAQYNVDGTTGWTAWQPDLVKTQFVTTFAVMVKF